MGSRIIATGHYLPSHVLKNDDLPETLMTSDAWITQRTGIRQRHIADATELTSDLGAAAALEALSIGGIAPSSIDLVICATSTPDDTFPATATQIAHKVGVGQAPAFDINAVCSGFVYGLSIAEAMLATGQARRALVIGAETYSRIVDWTDRSSCVLFGDGAGAVVMEATTEANQGILATKLYADGQHRDILYTDGGVSRTQRSGVIKMAGLEVFKHAVEKMTQALVDVCDQAGYTPQDIDWVVPHQANARIITAIAEKLNLPYDRIIETVSGHANTSAATIPLALHQGVSDGRIQKGQLVALTALGAGLTWGAALIRW